MAPLWTIKLCFNIRCANIEMWCGSDGERRYVRHNEQQNKGFLQKGVENSTAQIGIMYVQRSVRQLRYLIHTNCVLHI